MYKLNELPGQGNNLIKDHGAFLKAINDFRNVHGEFKKTNREIKAEIKKLENKENIRFDSHGYMIMNHLIISHI